MQKIIALSLPMLLLLASCGHWLPAANAANILGIFPSPSPSHLIVHMSLMKALAEKGHNITIAAVLEPKVTHPSIRQIIVPPKPETQKMFDAQVEDMTTTERSMLQTMLSFLGSFNNIIGMQADLLRDSRFTQLYEHDNKFDLVVVGFFMNDYALGVAAKFKCPAVISWLSEPNELINNYVGNPAEVAYVPQMGVTVKAGETMNFKQRIMNNMISMVSKFLKFALSFQMNRYYNELFGQEGKHFPSRDEMLKNVSLVFCNSHWSEGTIRPNVPALVEIGGIQIKEKPAALPEDIAKFLNEAPAGAILFSMGSNFRMGLLKPDIKAAIFKSLSQLKQRVIIKWEDLDNVPGKSANILYKKWLPQDDILAHPSIKLFITHAGKGGLAESQYHGVPMVTLPAFADQATNSDKVVASGYGVSLNFRNLNEPEFSKAIRQVLDNPEYAQRVKTFSKLYRDRPLSAKQSAVYWTEYVIRHHGAAHMQSPLVHMQFWQANNLDVMLIIALSLYLIYRILKLLFKLIAKMLCKSKKAKNGKNKTKKTQ